MHVGGEGKSVSLLGQSHPEERVLTFSALMSDY